MRLVHRGALSQVRAPPESLLEGDGMTVSEIRITSGNLDDLEWLTMSKKRKPKASPQSGRPSSSSTKVVNPTNWPSIPYPIFVKGAKGDDKFVMHSSFDQRERRGPYHIDGLTGVDYLIVNADSHEVKEISSSGNQLSFDVNYSEFTIRNLEYVVFSDQVLQTVPGGFKQTSWKPDGITLADPYGNGPSSLWPDSGSWTPSSRHPQEFNFVGQSGRKYISQGNDLYLDTKGDGIPNSFEDPVVGKVALADYGWMYSRSLAGGSWAMSGPESDKGTIFFGDGRVAAWIQFNY